MTWSEPRDLAEAAKIAETLGNCPLLPPDLRSPQAVFLIIGFADSLRINPFAALRSVQVINGKPTLSADGLAGVVLGSGLVEQWTYDACTDDVCRITAQRKGMAPFTVEWTRERARQAGLRGQQWEKYPRQMLRARCVAEAARQGWPDVCAGVYEPSELVDAPAIERSEATRLPETETVRAALPAPAPEPDARQTIREMADGMIAQLAARGLEGADEALRSRVRALAGGQPVTVEHLTQAYDELWTELESLDRR